MGLVIAYLAQGKVRIKSGTDAAKTLESPYATSIHQRSVRSQQRHAWKQDGDGMLSGPMLWGKSGNQSGPAPVLITSLSRGVAPGQLLYSLASGSLCALCEADNLGTDERRLWNDNRRKIQHIQTCAQTGDIACSIQHDNGTANIGVMLRSESGFCEVTEGDSVDTAPRWIPGKSRMLVYQSAGIGRNREGHFLALAPFSIHTVNIDSAEMETLAEDSQFDFLSPQMTTDGVLHYIRRPYNEHLKVKPMRALKDTLLLPFRLLFALLQFLNFFSMRYAGKKLSTPQGSPHRDVNLKQMMIWGNLVQAQQNAGENESMDLVPSSWRLIRRETDGTEKTLAGSVLTYDIAPDGTVAYTNGNALFVLDRNGRKECVQKEALIEQVAVLASQA
jgi:hypothetical protein